MKVKKIAAVLSTNKKDFIKKLNLVKGRTIQVDIMDNKFVKNKSISVKDMPRIKNGEAHLMVLNPGKYIDVLAKKGFKKIIFHYEAVKEGKIDNLIRKIKNKKMIPCIAVNPETSFLKIRPFLKKVNNILVMTVHPGFTGQRFLNSQLKKIKEIRNFDKKINIEVDGGINNKTMKKVVKAGANILAGGYFIYN